MLQTFWPFHIGHRGHTNICNEGQKVIVIDFGVGHMEDDSCNNWNHKQQSFWLFLMSLWMKICAFYVVLDSHIWAIFTRANQNIFSLQRCSLLCYLSRGWAAAGCWQWRGQSSDLWHWWKSTIKAIWRPLQVSMGTWLYFIHCLIVSIYNCTLE